MYVANIETAKYVVLVVLTEFSGLNSNRITYTVLAKSSNTSPQWQWSVLTLINVYLKSPHQKLWWGRCLIISHLFKSNVLYIWTIWAWKQYIASFSCETLFHKKRRRCDAIIQSLICYQWNKCQSFFKMAIKLLVPTPRLWHRMLPLGPVVQN